MNAEEIVNVDETLEAMLAEVDAIAASEEDEVGDAPIAEVQETVPENNAEEIVVCGISANEIEIGEDLPLAEVNSMVETEASDVPKTPDQPVETVVEDPPVIDEDPSIKLLRELEEVRALHAKLLAEQVQAAPVAPKVSSGLPRNKVPSTPHAGRKYVLLEKSLSGGGKIPQQQADLAKILAANLEVGKEYDEASVFKVIVDNSPMHVSIAGSRQDPTYLFRYYRGLARKGNHAGFIARNFLRMA